MTTSSALDLSRLEKVRHTGGGKVLARCPACAEQGGDRRGQHLVILPTGKFACAAAQGDGEHRRRIFALAGLPRDKPDTPWERPAHREARQRAELRDRRRWEQERQREREQEARRRELSGEAVRQRQGIVHRHGWDFPDVWADSPQRLEGGPEETCPRHFLRSLFPPAALVWTGETHHSGQDGRYAACWRTVEAWNEEPAAARIGPMTTPAIWLSGTVSRTAAQVRYAPYVVLDFDGFDGRHPSTPAEIHAHLLASLAIIRWLRAELHWRLAAILSTGHKSLHAWFHTPPSAVLTSLRETAPALGLDANLLGRPEHPCRLPGHPHGKTGNLSRVLWLA